MHSLEPPALTHLGTEGFLGVRIQVPEQSWLGSLRVSRIILQLQDLLWHRRNSSGPPFFAPSPSLWGSFQVSLPVLLAFPSLIMPWWPGRCAPAFPGFHSFHGKPFLSAPEVGPGLARRPGDATKPFSNPALLEEELQRWQGRI